MQAIDLLLTRNSHPKLTDPIPAGASLERIYQAALRAPDHGGLKPWHFIEFTGEGRTRLGDVFAKAELSQNPGADIEVTNKLRATPLRAPMIIAVVAKIQEHPKVPASEQLLSAGCAAHGLVLAAEAEGYAAMWRSGWLCFDPFVKKELGLGEADELVGFIYLGSPLGRRKRLPDYDVNDFVEKWS
jgi:nitroreductase